MEQYRKTIRRRMVTIGVGMILFIALMAVHFILREQGSGRLSHMYSFIRGTQAGMSLVITIIFFKYLIVYNRALKDENGLKKTYIKEHDEREREIYNRVGVYSFWISLCILLVAIVIAGFYSAIVFVTLGAVLIVEALIGAVLKLYVRNKL